MLNYSVPAIPKPSFIPEDFSHEVQTLADNCELLYSHPAVLEPRWPGRAVPGLAIKWSLGVAILSECDGSHPMLRKP